MCRESVDLQATCPTIAGRVVELHFGGCLARNTGRPGDLKLDAFQYVSVSLGHLRDVLWKDGGAQASA